MSDPLDKMAENARELGIQMQPAQQEPVAWTLLLVGKNQGLVGKAGEKFVGNPEHYERVDVFKSPPASKPLTPEWYARWLRNNYQDYGNIATLCHEMTKAAHGIKENT